MKEGKGGLRELHTVLWVAHARLGARGPRRPRGRRLDHGARAQGARRALRLPAARAQRGALLDGPQDRPAHARPAGRARPPAGLHAARRAAVLRALHARLLPPGERSSRSSPTASCGATSSRRARGLLGALRSKRPARGLEVRSGRLHSRRGDLPGGGAALLDVFATAQAEGVPLSDELKPTGPLAARLRGRRPPRRRPRGPRLRGRSALAGPRWPRAARDARDGLPRPLPAGVRAGELPRAARLLPPLHGGRAHAEGDRGARRGGGGGVARGQRRSAACSTRSRTRRRSTSGCSSTTSARAGAAGHVEQGAPHRRRASCARLRLDDAHAADVVFLVGAHLEMSQVSQQRDLTRAGHGRRLRRAASGSLERLDMLLLLTYADHRAVGPGIWNEWKGTLLWELYNRTRERLAGDPRDGGVRGPRGAGARPWRRCCGSHPEPDDRAPLRADAGALPAQHRRGTAGAALPPGPRGARDAPVAFEWRDLADGHCTELTVVADDREGLFARLAGTLTANGVDILSVDLFEPRRRRRDRHASVCPRSRATGRCAPSAGRRSRKTSARRSPAGSTWLPPSRSGAPARRRRRAARGAAEPASRRCGSTTRPRASATVIEVKAPDRPGLAWTIADTLARLGLDITFAKIATAKALALDVFYVTDARDASSVPATCPASSRH